ncbi:MAG: NADH-quinone oxidoreductase subunit K [Sedimenticola sp.]
MSGLTITKEHILTSLLALEVGAIRLFLGGVSAFGSLGQYEFPLVVMTLGVCEASVGLGLLIAHVRRKGNDFSNSGLILKN